MRGLICAGLLLLLVVAGEVQAKPHAEEGMLNLADAPLSDSGPVELAGHWHFVPGEFQPPGGKTADHAKQLDIPVPSSWGKAHLGLDDHGYGTYRLTVVLHERDVGRALGLDVPAIASAYDLYVNGERLASAGRIGTGRGQMEPAALPQTRFFVARSPEIELVVHVANYVQRKGGMWAGIHLGTAEQIAGEREWRILLQMFIASGLAVMGLYHVGYFAIRRETSALYFGLASFFIAFRTLYTGDLLGNRLFPGLSWEAAVKIEYLSIFWGVSFLVLYFYRLYQSSLSARLSYGLAGIMLLATLPVPVLPARIYTEWMLPYQLLLLLLVFYLVCGLFRAAAARLRGAGLNLFAGVLFLATVLNDILHYNFLLKSMDLVMLGLFLFLFTQMFMLAGRFSDAFRESERLKAALETANAELETAVARRTEQLASANEQLVQADRDRRALLSTIVHELGNPLGSIIGYVGRVKSGQSGEEADRHLEIAYRKALQLDRLNRDLRALVKLERDKLTFSMMPVPVARLLQELENAFDWELADRDVRLEWRIPAGAADRVQADAARIGQAYANLASNAVNHTGSGDAIHISARLYRFAGAVVITVRDSGIGIRREELGRIFERYFRGSGREGHHPGGIGLGLSIAREIVEAHGGRIGVRSKYGQGSAFYMILPLLEVDGP